MNIDVDINLETAKQGWSVRDFCRRYRLAEAEETRLTALFGEDASPAELLMNARRNPIFR